MNEKSFFSDKRRLRLIPIGYLIIILLTIFPFLNALIAEYISNLLGCHINEGETDGCVRIGIRFGDSLNRMFTSGWLFIITIPVGLVGFIIWSYISFNDWCYFNKKARKNN